MIILHFQCYDYYIKCFHVCFFSDFYDCYLNPCLNNGTCINELNDYNCTCVPGFVGKNCSNSKFINVVSQYKYQIAKFKRAYTHFPSIFALNGISFLPEKSLSISALVWERLRENSNLLVTNIGQSILPFRNKINKWTIAAYRCNI